MKARDIIELSQNDTSIGEYNKTTSLNYLIEGILDLVMDYHHAGEYTEEMFIPNDMKYNPVKQVAYIVHIVTAAGHLLSSVTDYELRNDNTIVFGRAFGECKIEYYGFPDLSEFMEDSEIPLPPMFQEALHWYLSSKFYSRVMNPVEATASYFEESYNAKAKQANTFYVKRRQRRRMPTRRI
jgi:hypothetical protein